MRYPDKLQRGLSKFAAIGAITGLGIVLLAVFWSITSKPATKTNSQQQASQGQTKSNEPPYIRIPENSAVYEDKTYGFIFSYPSGFGNLTEPGNSPPPNVLFRVESAQAANKPVGNGSSVLSGVLGAYVFDRNDFKLQVKGSAYVGPTKTGNDTTWKVVQSGNDTPDLHVGDPYSVQPIRSQTNIPVFNFTINTGKANQARLVFESGDKIILVVLPNVLRADSAVLGKSDTAAYDIIVTNLAKTIRVPGSAPAATNTTQP